VNFDYTVYVLHHHHFFDFSLARKKYPQPVAELCSFHGLSD